MRNIFSGIASVLLVAVVTVYPMALAQADPLDDAYKAYDAGDYKRAFKMFKVLSKA